MEHIFKEPQNDGSFLFKKLVDGQWIICQEDGTPVRDSTEISGIQPSSEKGNVRRKTLKRKGQPSKAEPVKDTRLRIPDSVERLAHAFRAYQMSKGRKMSLSELFSEALISYVRKEDKDFYRLFYGERQQ